MDHTYIPAFTLEPQKKAADTGLAGPIRRPSFIDDVAAGRVELPTIPQILQRLIAALRDPEIDTRKIAQALSRDPGLTAKVLRLANSSMFGGGQRSMASIEAAVAMIGTQALNRLIVACGVASTFASIPGIDMRVFWRDALVAAIAAGRLAPRLSANPEEAYVCGLLHATGHLILCQSYSEIANAMFTGFAVVRGAELCAIELEAFGIEHPAVGALWVRSLGFPDHVANSIGSTAQPLPESHQPLDLALHSACSLVAAVAQGQDVELALGALPPSVRAQFTTPQGMADASFSKLYDELRRIDPAF